MADKIPSLSERRAAANLPTQAKLSELAKMGRLTFTAIAPARARNPETGQMGDGFMVDVTDGDGRRFRSFVGGVVLTRELAEIDAAGGFPFTARIVREGEGEGHPYTFAD